ncbi:GH92 family glycosyl hydrolase [Proteiniphilum sp. X52]|uniref:GH92 family glycosyl hydrolase n=1 Tax=Proteiniphilum sp. X52 TaxID=2382159 RepID=UPI000F0A60CA|nr:GH92 family glycosyl hydrolase [Proteiniphilum sp. X52]RNC64047.1 glycoside hydrolase family 92 protein [Proteiniphilum sp. X52]
MKIRILFIAIFYLSISQFSNSQQFENYVNPLIGTDARVVEGKDKNSTEERGQVTPAVGVPHAMTNWVAQTQATEQKCHPPYYYFQSHFQGFRASHWMNGSCTQDYGSVTIMPLNNILELDPAARASAFSHEDETATPSYYSVELKDYNIKAEITGLSRSGIMQFDFRQEGNHYIVIEPNSDEGLAYIKINPEKKEIIGYNPVHRIYQGYGMPAGFSGHFVIQLNDDIEEFGIWEGKNSHKGKREAKGDDYPIGAWIKLSTSKSKKIGVKIGTSFTNIENARKNLQAEIPHWDFNSVRQQSSDIWNKTLGKIEIESNIHENKIKFYTALYETHFLPRVFSDVDGTYPKFDGAESILTIEDGEYYCDFSQWDTYRAVHPLFSLLHPTRNGHMANSLVLKAKQGGWLPIFPSWNSYTAAMIGDHCISMIGDAIIKDTPGFDYEEAYEVMRKNAFDINTDSTSYRDGKGRRAMESYLKHNYIPLEDPVKDAFHKQEQVSRTLEYAYDDFVLSQVAKKLNKANDYTQLKERALNYKNVIDPETGYARGRHSDGRWIEPFNPFAFAPFICEGTPYHYTWYVPQDVAGLIDHIGGKKRFTNQLDKFFEGGHYWHGNEPGHHIAYLYAYVQEPWKTQKWIHEIIENEYLISPDGLSGNEDAGQMSAWLVFSMLGFYPVCPGTPYYVIGSPSFEKSSITMEDGKKFIIQADNFNKENIYIQSATFNGEPYNKSYIHHNDIIRGGKLIFEMGNTPNKQWASSDDSIPPSLNF